MVQYLEFISLTSEAQALHQARAPRPCQTHGSEERAEKKKEKKFLIII